MTVGKVKMWFDPRWGEDGPALMGRFRRQALAQGWTKEEVDRLVYQAVVHGYDHLVRELEFWVVPVAVKTGPEAEGQ